MGGSTRAAGVSLPRLTRVSARASPRSQSSEEETQMFTGIVEELGEVVTVDDLGDAARLTVRGPQVTGGVAGGEE